MQSEVRPSPVSGLVTTEGGCVQLDFAATPMAVRGALETLGTELAAAGIGSDDRALAEIVLAEVLNNVVEHAYGHGGGWIELVARDATGQLIFTVSDWGAPMPGDSLPDGGLPVPVAELPEGGFGWHLIRALSVALDHGREGGRNWLRVTVAKEQTAPLG